MCIHQYIQTKLKEDSYILLEMAEKVFLIYNRSDIVL